MWNGPWKPVTWPMLMFVSDNVINTIDWNKTNEIIKLVIGTGIMNATRVFQRALIRNLKIFAPWIIAIIWSGRFKANESN